MEEPGRLQSMGSLPVGRNWATSLSLFTFKQWRRKWQPTPVFLPGESQGWQSLMGSHRVGYDWSDLAAAVLYKLLTFYGIQVARQVAQTLSLLRERTKEVIVKIKHKRKPDLKIPWADKTRLVIKAKINLPHFARWVMLTWSGSLLAYASGNHK